MYCQVAYIKLTKRWFLLELNEASTTCIECQLAKLFYGAYNSTQRSFFYARQHVMLSASLLRQRRPSVRPSVRRSVCHTAVLCQTDATYDHEIFTVDYSNDSSFFVTNFRAAG